MRRRATATTRYSPPLPIRSTSPSEGWIRSTACCRWAGTQHRQYRALVQPSFVPAKARWWIDNWIEKTVGLLVDSFAGNERADLNIEFCAPIPVLTITGSFGVSVEQALDIREALRGGPDGMARVVEILKPIIIGPAGVTHRRPDKRTGRSRDNRGRDEPAALRSGDLSPSPFSFSPPVRGPHGSRWASRSPLCFSGRKCYQAVAADRQLLRLAIEEALRWMPTDPMFSRWVTRDTDFFGTRLPEGAVLHICLGAANRDPARWDRPDEYEISRSLRPSFAFGGGAHVCLGMHVARAEMSVGISALLDRLPNLRLDPDAEPPKFVGFYERGSSAIPVVFD